MTEQQQQQRVINVSFDIHNTPFSTTPDFMFWCFSGGSDDKESACNVGDPDLIHGWEDPLEKEMATHSSILAWKIPWTE